MATTASRGEKKTAVDGQPDADIRDAGGLLLEVESVVCRAPKQFRQQSARHVEPLDHQVVHLSGQIVGFARDGLHLAAPKARRKNKKRQQHESA